MFGRGAKIIIKYYPKFPTHIMGLRLKIVQSPTIGKLTDPLKRQGSRSFVLDSDILLELWVWILVFCLKTEGPHDSVVFEALSLLQAGRSRV
jgi:hypothetical protein